MAKDILTAQELLDACVLKYSLISTIGGGCYNFPSCLEFYGFTVTIDADNNLLIAKDYENTSGEQDVSCLGWNKYKTLKAAYTQLDYLQAKLSRFERNYKKRLESKRLKKIKNDF